MSKEVVLYFDTIFWINISWKNIRLYVTRLRSRIYKAGTEQAYSRTYKLEQKIMYSHSAKLLSLYKSLIKNHHNISLSYDSYLGLYWLPIVYGTKVIKRQVENIIIKSLGNNSLKLIATHIRHAEQYLIILALEPRWKAVWDKSYIPFFSSASPCKLLSIFQKQIITKLNSGYYIKRINVKNILGQLSDNESIIARLNTHTSLRYYSDKTISESNIFKYIENLPTINCIGKLENNYCGYEAFLTKVLMYCIAIEAYYMHNKLTCSTDQQIDSKNNLSIFYHATDLYIISCDQYALNIWVANLATLSQSNKVCRLCSLSQSINLQKSHNSIDFLGYSMIFQYESRAIIIPSKISQALLLHKAKKIFQNYKGKSLVQLLQKLNSIICLWVNYFRYARSQQIFSLMDHMLYLKIRGWLFKYHAGWGKTKIIKRYFTIYKKSYDTWHLRTYDTNTNSIVYLQKILHVKTKAEL